MSMLDFFEVLTYNTMLILDTQTWTSQVSLVVKNLPAKAGDLRDADSIPGSRRSSGVENGNALQYSCLENPMDRRTWRVTVQRVTKSQTQLKQLSTHTCGIRSSSWSKDQIRVPCIGRQTQPLDHQGSSSRDDFFDHQYPWQSLDRPWCRTHLHQLTVMFEKGCQRDMVK